MSKYSLAVALEQLTAHSYGCCGLQGDLLNSRSGEVALRRYCATRPPGEPSLSGCSIDFDIFSAVLINYNLIFVNAYSTITVQI